MVLMDSLELFYIETAKNLGIGRKELLHDVYVTASVDDPSEGKIGRIKIFHPFRQEIVYNSIEKNGKTLCFVDRRVLNRDLNVEDFSILGIEKLFLKERVFTLRGKNLGYGKITVRDNRIISGEMNYSRSGEDEERKIERAEFFTSKENYEPAIIDMIETFVED